MGPGGESGWRASRPRREGAAPRAVPTYPTALPRDGPVILVLNHPSGLIDPVFLLCFTPRRVSLLAKAPLFRMPVIGWFCRALEAIPVYRRQDAGTDPAQNRETFETARRVLARGGAIGLFPEGTSHSEAKLRPMKTGAA